MKNYIIKIESYEGEASGLRCDCEGQKHVYAILTAGKNGAFISDYGYKSEEAAKAVCPEAIVMNENELSKEQEQILKKMTTGSHQELDYRAEGRKLGVQIKADWLKSATNNGSMEKEIDVDLEEVITAWRVEDIVELARETNRLDKLDSDGIQEISAKLRHEFDASVGMNWDDIDNAINEHIQEKKMAKEKVPEEDEGISIKL